MKFKVKLKSLRLSLASLIILTLLGSLWTYAVHPLRLERMASFSNSLTLAQAEKALVQHQGFFTENKENPFLAQSMTNALASEDFRLLQTGSKTWTTDADFAGSGTSHHNVNHGTEPWNDTSNSGSGSPHDQLQLSIPGNTYPFIWVPNTSDGTISLIATETTSYNGHGIVAGTVYGRYRTGPTETQIGFEIQPSRTSVDLDGNCWVANRYSNTMVKIQNRFAHPLVDLPSTPSGIQSSGVGGPANVALAWGIDDAVLWEIDLRNSNDTADFVETYRPGNNIAYSNSIIKGARAVAVDKDNGVWTGDLKGNRFYHITYDADPSDSVNKPHIKWRSDETVHEPYGAVVDRCGKVFFVSFHKGIVEIDPENYSIDLQVSGPSPYGIALDNQDSRYLYFTTLKNSGSSGKYRLYCYDTTTWQQIAYTDLDDFSKGVAVSDDGVWVAMTNEDKLGLYKKNNLNYKAHANLTTNKKPHGVSIDSLGRCWVVPISGFEIYCYSFDGTTALELEETANLGVGFHYAYSDMTGFIANTIGSFQGYWTVAHEAPCDVTQWTVKWNASAPDNTQLKFSFEVSDDGINWQDSSVPVVTFSGSNQTLSSNIPSGGNHIRVRVDFYSNPPCELAINEVPTPVLYDLTIDWYCDDNDNHICGCILQIIAPEGSVLGTVGVPLLIKLQQDCCGSILDLTMDGSLKAFNSGTSQAFINPNVVNGTYSIFEYQYAYPQGTSQCDPPDNQRRWCISLKLKADGVTIEQWEMHPLKDPCCD